MVLSVKLIVPMSGNTVTSNCTVLTTPHHVLNFKKRRIARRTDDANKVSELFVNYWLAYNFEVKKIKIILCLVINNYLRVSFNN